MQVLQNQLIINQNRNPIIKIKKNIKYKNNLMKAKIIKSLSFNNHTPYNIRIVIYLKQMKKEFKVNNKINYLLDSNNSLNHLFIIKINTKSIL